jgi:hypothetical protein
MYRRYPEILPWGSREIVIVAARAIGRAIAPYALRLACGFRLSKSEDVEFATYHRLWTWWFWSGFFRLYYDRNARGVVRR